MQQSSFESRLKRARLSSPGVSFDEIAARARSGGARRPGRGLLRLAIAAAAVWLIACLAHVAVDRSIDAIAPAASQSLAANSGDASAARMVGAGLAARQRLMQELVAEGMPAEELPAIPREHGKPDGRSSEVPGRHQAASHAASCHAEGMGIEAERASSRHRRQAVLPYGGAVV
jgi:hypothetical protein